MAKSGGYPRSWCDHVGDSRKSRSSQVIYRHVMHNLHVALQQAASVAAGPVDEEWALGEAVLSIGQDNGKPWYEFADRNTGQWFPRADLLTRGPGTWRIGEGQSGRFAVNVNEVLPAPRQIPSRQRPEWH